jgi:hypothetical protein
VITTMMLMRLTSVLLVHLAPFLVIVKSAGAADYVVTSTLEGDALDAVDNILPDSYAIFDKTRNVTLLYGQVAEPSSEPSAFPSIVPIESILPNWDFEVGTVAPWTSNNGNANHFSIVYDVDRQSNVGVSTGRTAQWNGFGQDVTSLIVPGEDYNVEFAAKLFGAAAGSSSRFILTIAIRYATYTSYQSFYYTSNGLTNQWKTFTSHYGPFQPVEPVQSLRLYFEGPNSGLSFAVDDVRITPDLTTESPSAAPTPAPTQEDYLVDAGANTELVQIPQPPQADLTPNTARSLCPHDDPTLTDWTTLFGTTFTVGQNINIPAGTRVLISKSIPTKLGYITIPASSSVVFGEDPLNGITLNVSGIDVQGSLIAGSESCRIQSDVTITLHGNRPSVSQQPTYKGISVTGTLSLHGKRYFRTWTRLARRAHAGEDFLYLQDKVNWEPGQEIVLVTTALRDSRDWHENEVFIIDRVETSSTPHPEVKSVVYLKSTIQYDHIGKSVLPDVMSSIGTCCSICFDKYLHSICVS